MPLGLESYALHPFVGQTKGFVVIIKCSRWDMNFMDNSKIVDNIVEVEGGQFLGGDQGQHT